jgi:hypothetical protein
VNNQEPMMVMIGIEDPNNGIMDFDQLQDEKL